MCIEDKIIFQIIPKPKEAGDASSTRIRERVRRVYMAK